MTTYKNVDDATEAELKAVYKAVMELVMNKSAVTNRWTNATLLSDMRFVQDLEINQFKFGTMDGKTGEIVWRDEPTGYGHGDLRLMWDVTENVITKL